MKKNPRNLVRPANRHLRDQQKIDAADAGGALAAGGDGI